MNHVVSSFDEIIKHCRRVIIRSIFPDFSGKIPESSGQEIFCQFGCQPFFVSCGREPEHVGQLKLKTLCFS